MNEDRNNPNNRDMALSEVQPVNLKGLMSECYLDYAVSVIVSRAIPDMRDGLKPVQRRILYSMYRTRNFHNKPHIKSARISGTVTANYHPHGEAAVYDTMVRLAQDFSMRLPLIDGQGNFGSLDRDPAAASRYTEVRLTKASESLLRDLENKTVDFMPNYDNQTTEPVVLPVPFPNILINGASGIAVGMATNIPPHNLGEVVDAACALLDDSEISIEELGRMVPGPDFPTGGLIWGQSGLRQILETGQGSIKLRAHYHEETINKRTALVFTDVPYQVNKASIVEIIAERVRDRQITHVSALRDESNMEGVRIVLELTKGASPEVIVSQLYKLTPLEVSVNVYMLMLHQGRPLLMDLKKILLCFLDFRRQVVLRRLRYLLYKAREQAFNLIGLLVAIANLDEFVRIIRSSATPEEAKKILLSKPWPVGDYMSYFQLISDPRTVLEGNNCYLAAEQVAAILDMKLQRLTALGVDDIFTSLSSLKKDMEYYLRCISSKQEIDNIVRQELLDSKSMFGTARMTEISSTDFHGRMEDIIPNTSVVITVSYLGYVKRVDLEHYRVQQRGGKGRIGMSTRTSDFVIDVLTARMHDTLLCFSSRGKVYQIRTYSLPESDISGQGRPIQNLINLQEGETVTNTLVIKSNLKSHEDSSSYLFFVTSRGRVRRNAIQDFCNLRSNGKIAFPLIEKDSLISVSLFQKDQHVFLFSRKGKCVRFPLTEVRTFLGRNSVGVRGMRLPEDDRIIGVAHLKEHKYTQEQVQDYLKYKRGYNIKDLSIDKVLADEMNANEEYILSITANGYGKRTSQYEYRITRRGGKGIKNIITSDRNGEVVFSAATKGDEYIVMITRKGQVIRLLTSKVKISGRSTQGVRLFKIDSKDKIVSVDYERISVDPDSTDPGFEKANNDDNMTANDSDSNNFRGNDSNFENDIDE